LSILASRRQSKNGYKSFKILTHMADPISDMFIRIKNAQKAGHPTLRLPYSKFKHEIAKTLQRSGFVGAVERKGKRVKKVLEIQLLAQDEQPMVGGVRLLSKPSRRLYASSRELRRARRGGIVILSTPKGVLTEREAKKENVGGELIAEVW
jgi:small subunit ribosomal protein S8